MLHVIRRNIFESPAQTLVNTVNTVGVMGKGVAKGFKARYPAMFREYKKLCDDHVLRIGTLHCWRGPNRWVLNFPTKTTWKKPSHIEYIESGLETFVANYKRLGIRSVSFPPLGCGNGQLDWTQVRPLMLEKLYNLDIPVYIHEWFETAELEQNQKEAKSPPCAYSEFLTDLHALVDERQGKFRTLDHGAHFRAKFDIDNNIEAYLNERYTIPEEALIIAWSGLQVGLLTESTLGELEEGCAQYLLPILGSLPYVQIATVQMNARTKGRLTHGLFLEESTDAYDSLDRPSSAQACLFP